MSQCVCDHSSVALRSAYDHLICSLGAGDHYSSIRSSPSLARRIVEASGLALFALCVSHILGHARALRTRVRLVLALSSAASLSRQRSLVSGLSPLELSLVSWHVSLSACHSSRLSHLLFRLLFVAGQPAFKFIYSYH